MRRPTPVSRGPSTIDAMSRWTRARRGRSVIASLLAGAAVTAGLALPAGGWAASDQQSILQDDVQLLYGTPQHQFQTMEQLKSIGVGVVKVSMIWSLVAPKPNAAHKPNFDASDPSAYPSGAWTRYDYLVGEANYLGLRVYFQFVPRDPRWAAAKNVASGQGYRRSQAPNLAYFRQFVTAVGKRYSGSWPAANNTPIPRVDEWALWNEPNWEGSLNPWHKTVKGQRVLTQPSLYRGIANTAYKALSDTGHRNDTILLGETADYGNIPPLAFMEDVYCVGRSYRILSGRSAQGVGCPTKPNPSRFVAQNPALFKTSGWSHHPYGFNVPPDRPNKIKTAIGLYNVGELERGLNGAFARYHRRRPGGIPIYLTEWGYVTNPPNPAYTTSLRQQATWLNQGEYMTFRDPYVKALAQFELEDVKTPAHQTKHQWSKSFTSGLEFSNGQPKPSLNAYRIPIWLPSPKHGSSVAIWGQLRAANHSTTQVGQIQFRPHSSSTWKTLKTVRTTSGQGFVSTHVSIGSAGSVRLSWTDSSNHTYYSRNVSIS
jgi:hypothetical protein